MQRSSDAVGTIAGALAKAQAELLGSFCQISCETSFADPLSRLRL